MYVFQMDKVVLVIIIMDRMEDLRMGVSGVEAVKDPAPPPEPPPCPTAPPPNCPPSLPHDFVLFFNFLFFLCLLF
jgi:hypothetical protein